MNNKVDLINELIKNLKSHQRIEILPDGQILISWKDSQGKRKTKKSGNININVKPDLFIPSKLWVTMPPPALKPYRDFGQSIKRHNKYENDTDILVAIFCFQLQIAQFKEYSLNDQNSHKYIVKETKDFKGYYLNNRLAKLEDKRTNITVFIKQNPAKLQKITYSKG